MASIQDVRLQLDERMGAAAALVTYNLRGTAQDVQQHVRYLELVQLIGDDKGLGEDGQDELIANGQVFADSIVFTSTEPVSRPPRLLALPSSFLNEDPGHVFGVQNEDEIRARVTLTRVDAPVTAESNLVVRGGFAVPPNESVPQV